MLLTSFCLIKKEKDRKDLSLFAGA